MQMKKNEYRCFLKPSSFGCMIGVPGVYVYALYIYIYSEYVVGGVAVLHLVVFSTDPPSTAWELKSIRKIPASLGRE